MFRFVFLLTFLVATCAGVSTETTGQYHDTVTLQCNEKLLGLPSLTVYLKYWVTPRGDVIQWFDPATFKYGLSISPEFNLTITNINSDDFGWYRCVVLWDNYIYLHSAINVGLNVDDADYSELYHVYARSALIGGLTAAFIAIVLGVGCIMYAYCKGKEKPETETKAVNELDRVVEKFDHALFEDAANYIYGNEARSEYAMDSMRSRQRTVDLGDIKSDILSELRSVRSARNADLTSEASGSIRKTQSEGGTLKRCPCCEELYASVKRAMHTCRTPIHHHEMVRKY